MTRTEYDGSISVLMDRYEGKRLSSPNDVVVKSDGSIWFTDSPFGIMGNYEDYNADPELGQNVYRLDPDTGSATVVVADVLGPNGLASSPDESTLYLVESRGVPTRKILAFDVTSNGTCLQNKRVLIDAGPGTPDGFRVDVDGNLWCGWGMGSDELDGVMVFAPDGTPIGRIVLPERCANLCFGGTRQQPPVHGGEHIDPCAVCERVRRRWRLRRLQAVLTPGWNTRQRNTLGVRGRA